MEASIKQKTSRKKPPVDGGTRKSGSENAELCTYDLVESRTASNIRLLPTPKPRRIDLKTLEQVRREMSKVYRDAREGVIPPENASRFAFVLSGIGKIIEAAQFEKRIEALEHSGNVPRIEN